MTEQTKTESLNLLKNAGPPLPKLNDPNYADAFAAALKLRPDSPRYLYNVAAMSALSGDPAAAISHLRQLAMLGVHLPAQQDADFASLQGQPRSSRSCAPWPRTANRAARPRCSSNYRVAPASSRASHFASARATCSSVTFIIAASGNATCAAR